LFALLPFYGAYGSAIRQYRIFRINQSSQLVFYSFVVDLLSVALCFDAMAV